MGQVPGNTASNILCCFYTTLQNTVGVGVFFIEFQAALSVEETISLLWFQLFDSIRRAEDLATQVNKMFPAWLNDQASLLQTWELSRLTYVHPECSEVIFNASKRFKVRVQVQDNS